MAQPGLGAQATVAGQVIRVGSRRFMDSADVLVPEAVGSRLEQLTQAGCTVARILLQSMT